jgi:hypothetical protein
MDSPAEEFPSEAEELRQALENPATQWVVDFLGWTLLIFLLLPLIWILITYSRKGAIASATWRLWLLLVLWQAIVSLVAPEIAHAWTDDKRAQFAFPEGNAVAGFAFIGWVPALILALVARFTRIIVARCFGQRQTPPRESNRARVRP